MSYPISSVELRGRKETYDKREVETRVQLWVDEISSVVLKLADLGATEYVKYWGGVPNMVEKERIVLGLRKNFPDTEIGFEQLPNELILRINW